MNDNSNHIKNLIFEKISGSIRPEDEAYLDTLISKPGPEKELWDEVSSFYNIGKGKEFLSSLNAEADFVQLKQEIATQQKKSKIRKIILPLAAAACVAAIILIIPGIGLLHQRASLVQNNEQQPVQQIRLQLESGEEILLSDSGKASFVARGTTIVTDDNSFTYESSEMQWATVEIPAGKDYKITLSDGSLLWINSKSKVRFPTRFRGDKRQIDVDGEVYLNVAKDAGRPFFVRTSSGTVEVLGTEFNLNTYDSGSLKLALVDGKVSLITSDRSTTIKPGQMGLVSNGEISVSNSFDKDDVLSWMNGYYNFYNASVAQISRILERCYPVNIVLEDPELKSMYYTGVIEKDKPLQAFLEEFVKSGEVEYRLHNGILRFSKAE